MLRVALLLSAAAVAVDLLPAGSRSGGDFTIAYTGRDTYAHPGPLDRAQLQLEDSTYKAPLHLSTLPPGPQSGHHGRPLALTTAGRSVGDARAFGLHRRSPA
jgi:hypothetical protein